MTWYAKPSGAYGLTSSEALNNVEEINTLLNNAGYTLESQAAILGNAHAESGLNPWRWQGDTYGTSGGYGLFQFTPAYDYIPGCSDEAYYAPNLSTTGQTSGARATDGIAQVNVLITDRLRKWVSSCWRSYWSTSTYSELYTKRSQILNRWGNGSTITMAQFRAITSIEDATFVFLACYEGPAVPNLAPRVSNANTLYPYLSGDTPIPPIPPTPVPRRKMPLYFYLKRRQSRWP